MQEQTHSRSAFVTGEFVAALTIDGLSLLLPHHQVRTLEPVADVVASQTQNEEIGWIETGGAKSLVYCLTRNLALLDTIPDVRRIAVLMAAEADIIGILCDDLKIVPRQEFKVHPLPICMRAPDSPITGLAILDGSVCCLSSADHMLNYLTGNAQTTDSRIPS